MQRGTCLYAIDMNDDNKLKRNQLNVVAVKTKQNKYNGQLFNLQRKLIKKFLKI